MAPRSDAQLVQIVDAMAADAARRGGAWVKCAPGCTQCCIGVFPISQLDAERLRAGVEELAAREPERANAVRARAREVVERLGAEFPGDARTGILDPERGEEFEEFGNEEPCPALDLQTGLCDLYGARPITCRVFGLPLRTPEGLGVCELCFQGASEEEIAACAVDADYDGLEAVANAEVERASGLSGNTIIAWALTTDRK
ncbi:MAG TPA: YkgJ family cysteine cluster protein [Acidobacteriaceae bacterium]|jgi:Fe-S-cluster containining protein|nr:YkgJ family cysteine cluster protein [Acidobacteriaceae bacterium]